MQLKKLNWKRLRAEIPCRKCGKDHPTGNCVSKSGRRVEKEVRE